MKPFNFLIAMLVCICFANGCGSSSPPPRLPDISVAPTAPIEPPVSFQINRMRPDIVELSFVVPPGVREASDDTVHIHYGCGGNGSSDTYFSQAQTSELEFRITNGVPRGRIEASGISPMFRLCGSRAVAVAVVFTGTQAQVPIWERVYISQPAKPKEF